MIECAAVTVTEGTVAEWDYVEISFVGKIDGEAFSGGTSTTNVWLTLNDSTSGYIPGFASGIVGCPDCAAREKEQRELSRLVAMSDELFEVEVSRDLHASIMQSVAQSPRTATKTTAARRASLRWAGALVAIVLLCGVLLIPGGPLNPMANAPSHDAAPPMGGNAGGDGGYGDSSNGAPNDDNEMMPSDPDAPFSHCLSRVPAKGDEEPGEPSDSPPGGTNEPSDSPSYDGEGDADNGTADQPEGGIIGKEQLKALHGEWKDDEVHLLLNTEAMLFGLALADGREYYGKIIWQYDKLVLMPDGDSSVMFFVFLEGDQLWLTR